MKRRYLYMVLVGVPGLVVSFAAAAMLTGMLAGVLWLFVFGDDPWPAAAEVVIGAAFAASLLTMWAATLIAGYYAGKRCERDASLNMAHVFASAGFTALLVAGILLYEWGIGNIGVR